MKNALQALVLVVVLVLDFIGTSRTTARTTTTIVCDSWTAVAERSGDTAFARAASSQISNDSIRTKAAWHFASRRSPNSARTE